MVYVDQKILFDKSSHVFQIKKIIGLANNVVYIMLQKQKTIHIYS